jgi:hypothetical protein
MAMRMVYLWSLNGITVMPMVHPVTDPDPITVVEDILEIEEYVAWMSIDM